MENYRNLGLFTYGNSCEICGNHMVEVHHIDYQEHQLLENKLRYAVKKDLDITNLLEEAEGLEWDGRQLSKNNKSTNLAVLCGNCHNLIHKMDVGMKLIKALPKRK